MMKFALFDFVGRSEVEVGQSSWIRDIDESLLNNNTFDFESDVIVKWPVRRNDSKAYCARVIMFGDNRQKLVGYVNDILAEGITDFGKFRSDVLSDVVRPMGRGQREKRRHDLSSSDEEEETVQPPTKRAANKVVKEARQRESNNIIEQMKRMRQAQVHGTGVQGIPEDDRQSAETMRKELEGMRAELLTLRTQNTSLKEENTTLKSENASLKVALSTLTELPSVLEGMRESVAAMKQMSTRAVEVRQPVSSSPPMSPQPTVARPTFIETGSSSGSEEEMDHRQVDETANEQFRPLSRAALARCSHQSSQKFVNDMMSAMFSLEYMASHSLSGMKSSKAKEEDAVKAPMRKEDVVFIIGETIKVFPEKRDNDIKANIRMKLNNSSKQVRK